MANEGMDRGGAGVGAAATGEGGGGVEGFFRFLCVALRCASALTKFGPKGCSAVDCCCCICPRSATASTAVAGGRLLDCPVSVLARLLFSFSLRCALMCALNADLFSAKLCPQIVHLLQSAALAGEAGIGEGAGLMTASEDGGEAAAFFLLAAVAPSVTAAPEICSWSAAAALATPEIWSWP